MIENNLIKFLLEKIIFRYNYVIFPLVLRKTSLDKRINIYKRTPDIFN